MFHGISKVICIILAAATVPSLSYLLANECTKPGAQCSEDCKRIILCPKETGNSIDIATCPDNLYCRKENDTAIRCNAYYCGTADFLCTTVGGVPDPTACEKYYLCPAINANGISQNCTDGKKFDVTKLECNADAQCDLPAPPCTEIGDMGAIDSDGIFCYICNNKLLPVVYPCTSNGTGTWFADDLLT